MVAQIALAAVLAVGSGLLVRSVWNLLAVDPGFGARSVLTVELSLPASRYPAERERYPRLTETIGFYEQALERVGRVPGVVSAAAALNPPLAQVPITQFHLVVRTAVPPLDLAPAVRSAVWSVDPELAPFDVTSMEWAIDAALGRPRLHMGLMTGFALAALLLADIGVYGLVAGLVTERIHETGVRMALGAGRVRVLLGVLRSGAGLAAAGLAVGLLCALVLSETLDALLFGVAPIDATVLAVVGAVLLGAALLASFVPARRASRLDPVEALRQE